MLWQIVRWAIGPLCSGGILLFVFIVHRRERQQRAELIDVIRSRKRVIKLIDCDEEEVQDA